MQFIKYNGSTTMKCSYHDDEDNEILKSSYHEEDNETFRSGNKCSADDVIHAYEEQARRDCWFDFDYFYNVALREFKEKWEGKNLTYDELYLIADEENAVYFLLRDLGLEDYSCIAFDFQEDCVDSIETEDN